MKDIPIIFSAPMVRAIMEGRKTVTRRLAHNKHGQPSIWANRCHDWHHADERYRLYVRETFGISPPRRLLPRYGERVELFDEETFYYADDPNLPGMRWTPAVHMPKRASRIFAPVVDMRIERLQDISEDDAAAEGVVLGPPGSRPDWGWVGAPGLPDRFHASEAFRDLWDHINGPGSWEANPEAVRIEFKPEVKR